MERCMIRMICGVRLVDVSTYVFCDMVDVVVKIEDFIIQSCCVGMFMSCMETSILKYVRL